MSELNITHEQGFKVICGLLEKDPEAQKRVQAHLRAITGKHTLLPVYHGDKSINATDKLKFYALCANAITKKDWSLLSTPARIDPVAEVVEAKPVEVVVEPAVEARPEAKPEQPAVVVIDEPPPANNRMSHIARAIYDELVPFLPTPERKVEAAVDSDLVKKLAAEVFGEQINNGGFPVDRVTKLIDEKLAGHASRFEFKASNGEFKPIEGLVHPQVTQVVTWLRATGTCWLWGASGGGKTHLARQVAEVLEVDPYVWSADPTTTVAKIMGYRNVANGEFVEGYCYAPFKNGGLSAADEIDTGDPGVIASANAMLSNAHYTFPNGEQVKRHPKFYFLALANTKGTGATCGYVARNKLDAATLDRFPVIELKYDPGIEMSVACGIGEPGAPWKPSEPADQATQQKFVQWVQKVREHCGTSVLISPRASINGCRALRAGVPMPEVIDALIFKLVASDSVQRIKDMCGLPY